MITQKTMIKPLMKKLIMMKKGKWKVRKRVKYHNNKSKLNLDLILKINTILQANKSFSSPFFLVEWKRKRQVNC